MLVYVVIGNRKWDGSYIMNIHLNHKKAEEEVKTLNNYNEKMDVKTRYHVEIIGVED